jgi:hypothetical protein
MERLEFTGDEISIMFLAVQRMIEIYNKCFLLPEFEEQFTEAEKQTAYANRELALSAFNKIKPLIPVA